MKIVDIEKSYFHDSWRNSCLIQQGRPLSTGAIDTGSPSVEGNAQQDRT